MGLLGFAPRLESCARCGRLEDPSYFVFKEGGLFCRGCLPAGSSYVRLSAASLQAVKGTSGTASLSFSSEILAELDQFLPKHLEYHLGRAPKAASFLR